MAKKKKIVKSKKKAQANKKLITVVVAVSVLTVVLVGGFWFINVYRGAARNISAGDVMMEEGNYKQAKKMYGRAVKKEQSNLSHIAKVQEAILSIVPVTPDEAYTLYQEYLGTLVHIARYSPNDADAQFALIYELHDAARRTNGSVYWKQLQSAVDTVLERLPLDHPRRYEAKIYRGLTFLKIENNSLTDTFDDDGIIRFPGEIDLLEALESDPGNELAWSILVQGRMSVYYRLYADARRSQAEKNREKAEQTMQDGLDAAGESLEMALVYARESGLHKARVLTDNRKNPGTHAQEEVDAVIQHADGAIDSVVASFDPALHYDNALEVIALLKGSGVAEKAVGIFKQCLEMQGDDQTLRMYYAGLLKELGRNEDAETEAHIVLNAPQGTVSLLSTQQFIMRPEAANLLFQIAIADIDQTEDEEAFERKLTFAKEHRDVVLDYVSGDTNDAKILEADGDLLLAQKDFSKAVAKYEELISRYPFPQSKSNVYHKSAVCLFFSGATGLSKERIEDAILYQGGIVPSVYILKARIEMELSDYDGAYTTLSTLPAEMIEENPTLQRMLNNIALQKSDGTVGFSVPIFAILSSVETLVAQGEEDEALKLLHTSIEESEETDSRLYRAMALIYQRLNDLENTTVWLDKAIALDPDSEELKQLKIQILSDNRVESTIAIIQESDMPEEEKNVAIAEALLMLSTAEKASAGRWARTGNEVAAKKAQELSDLAFSESMKYQQLAEESGGGSQSLTNVKYGAAMANQDFDLAKKYLEEAKERGEDFLVIGSKEILLRMVQAESNGAIGENSGTELKTALEIATQLTKDYPYSAVSWRSLGTVNRLLGDKKEEFLAFEEAYRLAPDKQGNVRDYLSALIKTSADSQRIMRVVRDARTSFPRDSQLEEMWLNLELQHGDKSTVLAYRMARYLQQPGDKKNALKLAIFLVNASPDRELLLNRDGSKQFNVADWARMSSRHKQSVFEELKTSWDAIVNDVIEAAGEEPPMDLESAIVQASIERDRGRLDEASKVLDQYITQKIGTEEYTTSVIATANFLQGAGRIPQAVSILESAKDAQSEKKEISATLGTLFLLSETKNYDRAVEELEIAAKATGRKDTYSSWIRALVRSNRFDEAEEALKGFEGTNIRYSKIMLQASIHRRKSEILLAKGNVQEANREFELYRASLTNAISADEENPYAYIQLCSSLILEYTITQNEKLLREALDIIDQSSAFSDISEEYILMRTNVLQADGQLRRAIEGLDAFLAKNPKSNNVRERLIEAHLDADDLEKATAVAIAGVAVNPASATWHQKLGNLYLRTSDDRVAATQSYLNAIKLEPSINLVFMLDNITTTDQPLPYRNLLQVVSGPLSKQHPIVKSIEAKALFGLGQQRDAEIAMKESWESYQNAIQKKWLAPTANLPWFANLTVIFKDSPEEGALFALQLIGDDPTADELVGLANYWWKIDRDKINHVITLLDQVKDNPEYENDAKMRAMQQKGAFLVESKRYDEGVKVFTSLNDEMPDSPLVLNNLSYVVGVYLDKPEEALVLALKAAELAPNHPSVIDTVSKLFELTGDFTKAAETLQFLLQIDPTNSNAMARLALLYAGELEQPERGLLVALRARSQKPRSPKALDALGWSYIQTGQLAKGERFLQRSIANGETSLAYLHMAQLVMNEGEYDEANGHLRLAEELSTDQHTLDRINALKDDIRKTQAAVGQ